MFRIVAPILILVLAVSFPVRAEHPVKAKPADKATIAAHRAKAEAAKTDKPVVLTQLAKASRSTKGARLMASTILPNAKSAVASAKKTNLKAAAPVAAASANGAAKPGAPTAQMRLARITCYYTEEDQWTAKHQSSTGAHLEEGYCAVDPKLIPYGSLVQIPGLRPYTAVDTGSAVISRQAAIGAAETAAQRNALVIDLFFETRKEAMYFAQHGPTFATVSWSAPMASADAPNNPRALPMSVPKLPAGAVYVLAEAPTMADIRMPLAFRMPQL